MDEHWRAKWNKPITKRYIMWFHFQYVHDSQNHKYTKYNGGCQGLRVERMGSSCLIGREFQFYKMKKVMGMGSSDGCTKYPI